MKIPGTDDGWPPPEGNGHQAEFSHDNQFVLAADEDFDHVPPARRGRPGRAAGIFRFFSGGVDVDGATSRGRRSHDPAADRATRATSATACIAGDHPAGHARRVHGRGRRARRLRLPGKIAERRGARLRRA